MLVTGGAGFIGSNLVRHLLRTRPEISVTNLDALTYAGSLANLQGLPVGDGPGRYAFVHGNICDRVLVERLIAEQQIDTIIHLAAETHVDRSISGPAPFIETNITGTFTLLEAARLTWGANTSGTRRRFHHVSTDEVYGSLEADAPAPTEGAPYAPSSPYAASKAAADHLVGAYVRTYGLDATISSCSNNYGPHQFPEKLIPLMIVNAMRGKPLPIYGDGQNVRDWLHVEDHCEAIVAIVERGFTGQTYHVAGGVQRTNLELVELLCGLLDARLPDSPHRPHKQLIESVADRLGHDRRYALDTTKIRTELGWSPRHALAEGLAATLDWYLGAERRT
ncbi:MAG: rmlB [Myxococcales bacterium]|nr:rmlB [Myxococcales bacterium]